MKPNMAPKGSKRFRQGSKAKTPRTRATWNLKRHPMRTSVLLNSGYIGFHVYLGKVFGKVFPQGKCASKFATYACLDRFLRSRGSLQNTGLFLGVPIIRTITVLVHAPRVGNLHTLRLRTPCKHQEPAQPSRPALDKAEVCFLASG